ncbi:MAG: hypothetical protein Q8Q97_00135 [bacterium]|nr:hypothetical protein [bacterium]
MDNRWRNLLIIALVIAIGAGVYFFVLNKGPSMPQPDTAGTDAKLDFVFAKHGAKRADFSGGLPVTLGEEEVDSKISASALAGLGRDLNALARDAKSGREKELVLIYARAAELSQKKYDLLRQLQQLSSEIAGKEKEAACAYSARVDELNGRYTDFFISLTGLSLAEIDYSKKYGAEKPLGIGTDEERETMDSLAFLSELYSSCTGAEA